MAATLFLLYLVFTLLVLHQSLSAVVWEVGSVLYLIVATFYVGLPWLAGILLWSVIILLLLIVQMVPCRMLLADWMYKKAVKAMPKLSKTESQALQAGDTWLEEDVFRGQPDWAKLAAVHTELTAQEQSFLDNETQTLCSMLDDWEINQAHDMPPEVWQYLKDQGFFGLIIPEAYGGKGFSARAHSDVVMKIASRSGVAAVTVMVPNSLGPGELIHYYGTEEQKAYYLPRLAKGIDVPCFALTEPCAGSDATSIQSHAVVVKKKVENKTVLGLLITLDKRWITLAPVATLIGVAVQLTDPNHLLQGEGEEGITCVLIPRDTENLEIGNRHLPENQAFMNGTVRGKDLFVPITTIIGGQKNAGRGWHMLVECLSIGRSISLPALATASSSMAYLTSGAFARIRRQFNVEIAQFEGVAEKLAEIAGLNYLINATRLLTAAAVNAHKKPSVASAITKYFNTELARKAVGAAMDIHGGCAVVNGPRNYLANFYHGLPISITVEGANIMTRNLLIFGQGSMACHPFVREELQAVLAQDKATFRTLIWQHLQYTMRNMAAAICSAYTGGWLTRAPKGPMKREYKKLARLSQAYAWLADVSLMVLGGDLKRKERVSARLADGMSYLYMAMAVLRNAQLHGYNQDDRLHAQWATAYCFYHAQQSLIALCKNFPAKLLGFAMRMLVFPLGQTMAYPSDTLDQALAQCMVSNNQYRDRLKQSVYFSGDPAQHVDRLEMTLQQLMQHATAAKTLKTLKGLSRDQLKAALQDRVEQGVMQEQEAMDTLALEQALWDAVLVDEFTFESMKNKTFDSVINKMQSPLR